MRSWSSPNNVVISYVIIHSVVRTFQLTKKPNQVIQSDQIEEISLAAWCAAPQNISHGTVYLQPDICNNGRCQTMSAVSFVCYPGYYLVGFGTVLCAGRDEWNLPFPTCAGKSGHMLELRWVWGM